jgi:S1-C subfamily serine protease
VKVTFPSGRVLEGVVRGVDEASDLAVVAVQLREGETLYAAPMGDSDTVQVGNQSFQQQK